MKRIIVFGAASDIAKACMQAWAAEGAGFFLFARDATQLEIVAADLKVRGAAQVTCKTADFDDIKQHAALVEEAAAGGAADTALVCYGSLPDQSQAEKDADYSANQFFSNANGPISLAGHLAKTLEKQGGGTLIVVSSVAGDRGRRSNYCYGAAKAAVSTYCAGLRLAHPAVKVVLVKPGFVDTKMTKGLPLPKALTAAPTRVAQDIIKGGRKGRAVVYTPWFWRYVMLAIRHIPDFIFRRLPL